MSVPQATRINLLRTRRQGWVAFAKHPTPYRIRDAPLNLRSTSADLKERRVTGASRWTIVRATVSGP